MTTMDRIGVDVETGEETDLSLFKDMMKDVEWKEIQNAEDKQKAFFEYWTKKEAVIKANGRGLSISLNQIHLRKNTAVLSGQKWSKIKVGLRRPYIFHVAIDRSDDELIIKEIKTKELSNNWTRIYTDCHG